MTSFLNQVHDAATAARTDSAPRRLATDSIHYSFREFSVHSFQLCYATTDKYAKSLLSILHTPPAISSKVSPPQIRATTISLSCASSGRAYRESLHQLTNRSIANRPFQTATPEAAPTLRRCSFIASRFATVNSQATQFVGVGSSVASLMKAD